MLDQQLRLLQAGASDLHQLAPRIADIPETFLDHENYTEHTLDAMVREFAETGRWPALSPVERTMLVFRLEYASSLAHLLGHLPEHFSGVIAEPSLDVPEERVLEWLLNEAWHSEGFSTIHDTCTRLLTALPPDNQ